MNNWTLKKIGVDATVQTLTPGDRAELGFTVDGDIVREHLWVRVFATLWHGKAYLGSLEKDAATIDTLKSGQAVTFKAENVVRVRRGSAVTNDRRVTGSNKGDTTMKKMIDVFSEEGVRIHDEIEEQVRAELGLTGVSVDDMSDEDYAKFKEALISQCEHAGVSFADVLRSQLSIAIRVLRLHGEDEKAELFEAMLRRGEN